MNTDNVKVNEDIFHGRIYGLMRQLEILRFINSEKDVIDCESLTLAAFKGL